MEASVPKRLGRHDVLDRVAVGGMANVYLARRIEHDGHIFPVALKVIKRELNENQEYVDMFRDEAALLSRLSHPNIVQTIEADITGGHRWIAMEMLLGRTLEALADECEARGVLLAHDLAAWICARVAHALHFAHELVDHDGTPLAIVHRDANPSNIILTYDGRVKLIDFGLAKAARRRSKSREGIIKGKVSYFSPEQLKQREIDHRSDVYTLGATLWELTTGRRLWKRATDLETVQAIQSGVVPDPTKLVPGYPEELWAITWQALMPHPDHRYPDAATMAADLDAFVSHSRDSGRMTERAKAFVESLFPGEHARRKAWVMQTVGVASLVPRRVASAKRRVY